MEMEESIKKWEEMLAEYKYTAKLYKYLEEPIEKDFWCYGKYMNYETAFLLYTQRVLGEAYNLFKYFGNFNFPNSYVLKFSAFLNNYISESFKNKKEEELFMSNPLLYLRIKNLLQENEKAL